MVHHQHQRQRPKIAHPVAQPGVYQIAVIRECRQLAAHEGLQFEQQVFAVVSVDAAPPKADALQIQRDDQVIESAAHHAA